MLDDDRIRGGWGRVWQRILTSFSDEDACTELDTGHRVSTRSEDAGESPVGTSQRTHDIQSFPQPGPQRALAGPWRAGLVAADARHIHVKRSRIDAARATVGATSVGRRVRGAQCRGTCGRLALVWRVCSVDLRGRGGGDGDRYGRHDPVEVAVVVGRGVHAQIVGLGLMVRTAVQACRRPVWRHLVGGWDAAGAHVMLDSWDTMLCRGRDAGGMCHKLG